MCREGAQAPSAHRRKGRRVSVARGGGRASGAERLLEPGVRVRGDLVRVGRRGRLERVSKIGKPPRRSRSSIERPGE